MNIQPNQSDKPGFLVLDVNNASCWEPFFGKSYFLPRGTLVTVQNPLTYNPVDVSLAFELQNAIETRLKENFMGWRKRFRYVLVAILLQALVQLPY